MVTVLRTVFSDKGNDPMFLPAPSMLDIYLLRGNRSFDTKVQSPQFPRKVMQRDDAVGAGNTPGKMEVSRLQMLIGLLGSGGSCLDSLWP
jgi:hypothetical protein